MVLEMRLPVGTCINPMGLRVLLVEEDGIAGTNVVPASTCVVEADQRQNGSGAFHHHRMNKDHPVLGHQTQDLLKAAATATTRPRETFHVKPPLADTQGREGPYVFKEDNSVTLLSFYHLELAFYDV